MPINPDAAGAVGEPEKFSWNSKDALLYAIGVGAGTDELAYTTENTKNFPQQVLPSFAVVIASEGGGVPMDKVGSFDPTLMVHGAQSLELYDVLPVEGEVEVQGTIKGIYDKGKAAVIDIESVATDTASGKPLYKLGGSIFCRGEGGWGGDRGPSHAVEFPERAPDHEVSYTTTEDQALIYRLSGDRNPLHSDPDFAAKGGFPKPILHGLCTWGVTGRGLLHTLCDGDPARFKAMKSRFSKPVFPGDTLTVAIWLLESGQALFKTFNQNGDVVIDQGEFTCLP
jgi:acyl dehydratase